MARPHSPKIKETARADGTTKFSARLMIDGDRVTIPGQQRRLGRSAREPGGKLAIQGEAATQGRPGGRRAGRSRRRCPVALVADVIEAAGTPRPLQRQRPRVAARAELIVRLRDEERLPWKAIVKRVGVAESTAIDAITTYFKSRGLMSHDDPAFPDGNGRRRDKGQANVQVFRPATQLANDLRRERGDRPLPHVTPHILPHTYISLALETGYSVPYVMQQVGHRDPRMPMRVYAKVCARRDRGVAGRHARSPTLP